LKKTISSVEHQRVREHELAQHESAKLAEENATKDRTILRLRRENAQLKLLVKELRSKR
jgi:hypothetical protein